MRRKTGRKWWWLITRRCVCCKPEKAWLDAKENKAISHSDLIEVIEDGDRDELVEERENYYAEVVKANRRRRWRARLDAVQNALMFWMWLPVVITLIFFVLALWAWDEVRRAIRAAWARWAGH
ncbi:hypothetical protein PQR65_12415 [Paraburkholderia nemoris]|uniref:hypothetical protein n=1 Tax=Paraburkholderia nemoris TaxID=2793076 RepID=UPI0038BD5421